MAFAFSLDMEESEKTGSWNQGGTRWAMKTRFLSSSAVLIFALATLFSLSAWAQTTDPGPGPSEQPNAPMEVGQQQPTDSQSGVQSSDIPPDGQSSEAQPSEAQPGGPTGEAPASTDMGVARISMIHGDVSTQRGDSGEWSAATLNQPVVTGDKVSTGDSARAELQLDYANTLRIGPNSKANIANLTKKQIQIQLGQGIANYSVWNNSEAEPEIDTPNVSVHPAHQDGVFRVEVRPDGDTLVIVRKGEAQISTPQGSTEIRSGEMATVRGDINSAQYKIGNAPDPDDWDRWNADRDHMIQNAQSWRHTNHYYTGAQDLDTYGQWQNVPDYGNVWVPNEPEGWAPYRDGNWVWEPYYGWTWVGYEPWGWAPYHYGRWFWWNNAWAWWPGPAWGWYRPFWAPAYVSFWGWGGGWGFGIGFGWGGFGWLPIGPCDWFHPWWGGYRGRFGWVDHGWGGRRWGGFAPLHGGTRFSNINNIHDAHIYRAMSTVGAGRFGAGRVTAMPVTRQQLNGAHMMAGNLPVMPTHASLSASGRPAAPSTIRNGGSERFFGSTHNNMARPASFQQQTASLRQSMQSSHVRAIPAGGRMGTSASFAARSTAGTVAMKPTAGSFANRSNPGNSGFSNRGSVQNGARAFTPPSNTAHSSGGSSASNAERGTSSPRMSTPQGNGGFRPFTPPANSSAARGGSQPGSGGSYWNRTSPSSSMGSRGYGAGNYGAGNYSRGSSSRPQLDMRQPIVRGPSYGGYSRPSYGGGGYGRSAAPSYGAPRAGYPGGYGGRSAAPSPPRGGFGGGGRSYGGGGGGHSYGGGGGHSGGGGGHSGGGGGHGGGGRR
jgi:hypothetical protein